MELTNEQKILVKDLRNRTGCGLMECRKALTVSNWDMDKAIAWLNSPFKSAGFTMQDHR